MYKRLSQEEIELIKREQQNDRLFINLYDAIGAVGLDFDDISPEEIWKEASAQVRIIANAEQRTFSVKTLHTSLCHKYLDYVSETGEKHHRTKESSINTAFLVELTILYQLTVYQRTWENHPYKDYCLTIYNHISTNPIFKEILPKITATNDEYEKVFNSEIPEHDYMPEIVKEDSVIKEAVQISIDCAQYLSPNYTTQWLIEFWTDLIQSKHKEQLIQELQNNQKYTTIYKIIGLLLRNKVYNATQRQLSKLSKLSQPSKDTVRRYISSGYNNDTIYDTFVNDYVSNHKPK